MTVALLSVELFNVAFATVAASDEVAEQTLASVLGEIERLEPGLVSQSRVEHLR